MEIKTKRIYPSTQLVVGLDAKVLKVLMWICGWSSQGSIKYYPKQFAKACKMEEEEVEKCIQALINIKLISISKEGQNWMITPNADTFQKSYEYPMAKVLDGKTIVMSENVTWNQETKVEAKQASNDIEDMSEADLKRLLLRIEASLSEKQQLRNCVVTAEPKEVDDLPY